MPDYIVKRKAPPNRQGFHDGSFEEHFPEASVMLAFALHLLGRGATEVEMHPDGMHVRNHDLRGALMAAGFAHEPVGRHAVAGRYSRNTSTITVTFVPGIGDVVATVGSEKITAECKGGVINTRHPGRQSSLRKGLCEAVGQLLGRELLQREKHVAVVPSTATTRALASRMAQRANGAGIELALVSSDGAVHYVVPH